MAHFSVEITRRSGSVLGGNQHTGLDLGFDGAEDLLRVPYLDTLRWVLIVIALIGIAVTIHARLDDWKRGQR